MTVAVTVDLGKHGAVNSPFLLLQTAISLGLWQAVCWQLISDQHQGFHFASRSPVHGGLLFKPIKRRPSPSAARTAMCVSVPDIRAEGKGGAWPLCSVLMLSEGQDAVQKKNRMSSPVP